MKFKELLKIKDIHGAQIARRLGVHRATITNWSKGKGSPDPKHIRQIAEILGMSVAEVVECFLNENTKKS